MEIRKDVEGLLQVRTTTDLSIANPLAIHIYNPRYVHLILLVLLMSSLVTVIVKGKETIRTRTK